MKKLTKTTFTPTWSRSKNAQAQTTSNRCLTVRLELIAAVGGHIVDLSSEANQSCVDTELAKKADSTHVGTQLSHKASVPYVNGQIARNADVTWRSDLIVPINTDTSNIQTELDNKVDSFVVASPLQ